LERFVDPVLTERACVEDHPQQLEHFERGKFNSSDITPFMREPPHQPLSEILSILLILSIGSRKPLRFPSAACSF